MRHKLGHWVWGLWRGKVIERVLVNTTPSEAGANDAAGTLVARRMLGSFQDISERKQAAMALQQAQAKVQPQLEATPLQR